MESTTSSTPVTIATGDTTNTVNVSPTRKVLGDLNGLLSVKGSGSTTLVLDDRNDNATLLGPSKQDRVTNSNVQASKGHSVQVNYSGIKSLTLDESADSTLTVDGTAPGVPVTVTGGNSSSAVQINATSGPFTFVGASQADQVTIGNGSLASIAGPVNVSNRSYYGTGVILNDRNDVTVKHFVIKSASISGEGLPTINFSGSVKSLSIYVGSTPNTLEFDSLPASSTGTGTATTKLYGSGKDVTYGAAAKDVQLLSR